MAGFDPTTYYNASTDYEAPSLYNGFRYPGANDSPWKIELAIDLAANGVGDWFTLDDSAKGVLDNATYLLAGDVFIDITRWVRSLSVSRGRSRRLQRFTAGTCRIDLDNRDRLFDPLMEASPLFGSIVPRKEVRVSYQGSRVFTGNVEDWDYSYDISGDSIATAVSADALSFLSRRTYPAATETQQSSLARFTAVLDGISWPPEARVVVGQSFDFTTLYGDTHDDTSALQYLQNVELSEIGVLFANRDGLIEFHGALDYPYNPTFLATFGVGGIPFFGIQVSYETDVMTNSVTCKYQASSSTTSDDSDSQEKYGMLASSYDTLLANGTDAQGFNLSYLGAFKEPTYYISELSVNMLGLSTVDALKVLSLELADPVEVIYRPNDTGEPQEYALVIEGISHDVTPNSHIVTFKMAPPIVSITVPI